MYAYLDRPTATLDEGGKILVWAMRQWTAAVGKRSCPIAALGKTLAARGLISTLAPFHRVMSLLATRARQDLPFAPFWNPLVAEGEALLLTLVSDCRGARAHTLETTLFLLIEAEARDMMHDALLSLGEALDGVGMLPSATAPLT